MNFKKLFLIKLLKKKKFVFFYDYRFSIFNSICIFLNLIIILFIFLSDLKIHTINSLEII